MNILIYIPMISQDWGGVRQYSIALIRTLAQDSHNSYFVYHQINDPEVLKLLETYPHLNLVKDEELSRQASYKLINRFKRLANFILRRFNAKYLFKLISDFERLCKKYSIDIVHCPYQYIPPVSNVKLITTMHDVQELHFPEYFTPRERHMRAGDYLDFLERSDRVVVSYNHVKKDLIKYFQIPESKICQILLDMKHLWFEQYIHLEPKSLDTLVKQEVFLLYPANTWKHKNHLGLIESISYLKNTRNLEVHVVCTGHTSSYYHEEIYPRQKELDLLEQVQFIGIVDETTLYSLYKNALGVVIPTIYEAGSFPLMESILMGVPVICSNVTSLPETIGNEKFVFNPHDIPDMAGRIEELWLSEEFRNLSVENSHQVANTLTHTGGFDKLLTMYSELAHSRQTTTNERTLTQTTEINK